MKFNQENNNDGDVNNHVDDFPYGDPPWWADCLFILFLIAISGGALTILGLAFWSFLCG